MTRGKTTSGALRRGIVALRRGIVAPCHRPALGLAALLVACASTATPIRSDLGRRFERESLEATRDAAPDLMARAERARQRALAAEAEGHGAAAQDYAQLARTWLEAAEVEAQRVAEHERTLAAAAREREALAHVAEHERTRRRIEARIARRRAAAIALDQAQLAFTAAEGREARTRRQRQEAAHRLDAATRALLDRARMVLATARAMQAPGSLLDQAQRAIDAAAESEAAPARFDAAEVALGQAQAALGTARAKTDGPSAEEAQALITEAQQRGLRVEHQAEGARIVLPAPFVPGTPRLAAKGRRALHHVADLLKAHPHGPVRVALFSSAPARVAERQVAQVLASLQSATIAEDRLDGSVVHARGETHLDLMLPAYARQAPPDHQLK